MNNYKIEVKIIKYIYVIHLIMAILVSKEEL